MDNVAEGIQTELKPPAEQARAALIQWCKEHGLPVPPKPEELRRSAQSDERR